MVAILVDGAFFLKRYFKLNGKDKSKTPEKVADDLYKLCVLHLKWKNKKLEDNDVNNVVEEKLYRIFYYDCFPFDKKIFNPFLNKTIDFSKTDEYKFRTSFFNSLKRKRKVALRLGELKTNNNWQIHRNKLIEIIKNQNQNSDLSEKDFYLDLKQKSVDIMIGIDIATLALKKQVNQIILISGDSDFVPAAKLARIEGIDFILDPMWNNVDPNLLEHIDGLRSTCKICKNTNN